MDFTIWKVKGYNGIVFEKDKLNDKKYSFDEIGDRDSNIIKDIEENLDNGGVVFGLEKKKTIKVLYFFKLTTKRKERILVLDKKIVLDVSDKCIEEFENDLDQILNKILYNRVDVDKAVWREKELTEKEMLQASISTVKIFSWIGIIFFSLIAVAMIVVGTNYSLTCASYNSIEEIKNDEEMMDYVAEVNNYNYYEMNEAISSVEDSRGFAIVDIAIPTLYRLAGLVLLILALKDIVELVSDVTNSQTLFTEDKNKSCKKLLLVVFIGLFFVIKSLILWLAVGTMLEIVAYLFNYCVQLTNSKK